MGSYVPCSPEETEAELHEIGLSSLDDLYQAVPKEVYLKKLPLPEGKSEMEVLRLLKAMAGKNTIFSSIFRGAGAYNHYIPAIVKQVISKEAFRTTYTPYQAEISQGILQSIFEYQTMICQLTGMDVSNASVYDGATAAAESIFMCQERKRSKVLVCGAIHPEVLAVMKTYCESRSVELVEVPAKDGTTDLDALKGNLSADTAMVYFQSPNYYGLIEDGDAITAASHEAGAKVVMSVSPIALGLMKTPGEYGVDIAVGDGQALGMPLSFGGPYMGFMTCTSKMMRKLPGRIVGETVDHEGRRCFVLTLQAREQHIRREKASSNICSNEALCTMTAGAYLGALGPDGMKTVATLCYDKAHYLADELEKIGFKKVYDKPFFDEFLTEAPSNAAEIEKKLASHGILGGLSVDGYILWCATEMNSKEEIDTLISILKGDE